jgi:hypothetical protein
MLTNSTAKTEKSAIYQTDKYKSSNDKFNCLKLATATVQMKTQLKQICNIGIIDALFGNNNIVVTHFGLAN